MTTLIEEMKLLVLQIWQSLGFERSSRTAAAVVPVLVLGIALNVIALGVVDSLRTGANASCEKAKLATVARTELKTVQAVVFSTLKRIGDGHRGLCSATQWVQDRHAEMAQYRRTTKWAWMARVSSHGIALNIRMERPDTSDHCHSASGSLA